MSDVSFYEEALTNPNSDLNQSGGGYNIEKYLNPFRYAVGFAGEVASTLRNDFGLFGGAEARSEDKVLANSSNVPATINERLINNAVDNNSDKKTLIYVGGAVLASVILYLALKK